MSVESIEKRSLKSLEWDKLVNELSLLAQTLEGRARLSALRPELGRQHLDIARLRLSESQEAAYLVAAKGEPDLSSLEVDWASLEKLAIGATLGTHELLSMRRLLSVSRRTRNSLLLLEKPSFPLLHRKGELLISRPNVEKEIELAIEDDGSVKDTASSLLSRLRQDARKLEDRVKEELRNIIHKLAGSKVLTDELYTVRHGRFVLPVNSSMRYQIEGVVHDASSTGLTVYVEPLSVMELSNLIRLKGTEIEAEIERILDSLSRELLPYAAELKASYEVLIDLDCIFARGRLAHLTNANMPELTEERSLMLKEARHPLLMLRGEAKSVIGNDVILEDGKRALLITGPNTGGKTVFIKTVGLCALMVRAGLIPPVGRGSRLGLFDLVAADIGDEQSLEQSLSTFSSHMKNIIEIVEVADTGLLVLLDEVGAGTDPKEGAALSQAILEELEGRRATFVATTHLGALKALAFGNSTFLNGSFEFDEENLRPTYRLRLGVPGESKAIAVASRLGLNENLVARAKSLMGVDSGVDLLIKDLTEKMASLSALEEKNLRQNRELVAQTESLSKQEAELKGYKEKLMTEERSKLLSEFEAAKKLVAETVKELQRSPSLKKAEKARQDLEVIKSELKWKDEENKRFKAPSPDFKPGAAVRHLALNQIGSILAVDGEQLLIQLGSLKVKARPAEIEAVSGSKLKEQRRSFKGRSSPAQVSAKFSGQFKDVSEPISVFVRTAVNTLDLRGKRVDEALQLSETFIDSCVLARISPFMIIHGHGTGAVKQAVRSLLSEGRYKIKFRPGELYEGGDGVTVIEIN